MYNKLRYILLTIMLIVASQAAGQYIIDTVCAGSVKYYRIDGEPGSSYTWNLTDPLNNVTILASTADTVEIIWNVAPGIYKLSAIQHAAATGCDGVKEIGNIEVIPLLIAGAGPNDTSCANLPYALSGAFASNFSRLEWTSDGLGAFSDNTAINPVYIPGPNETGLITFTLHAYSLTPCTDTITDAMSLLIYPLPTAVLSLAGRDTLCGGDTTFLRVDLTGTAPWSLTISEGATSTTINNINSTPYIGAFSPGSTCVYTITAVSDVHCSALPSGMNGIVPILVNPRPGAEFTWHLGSQNNEIHFVIDSTVVNLPAVGNMVLWNFGDGTYGYETNPVHLYMASNTYIVTLTVTDTVGCVSFISHNVYVPEIPIAFYASTSPSCLGTATCFTDLSSAPGPLFGYIVKWSWEFGDGSPAVVVNFPDNPNVCHTYSAIGTYPTTLTITSDLGYVSTYTHDQVVIPGPVAGFTHTTGCTYQPVQFTDTSIDNNGGSIFSWKWNFGDPASGSENTSVLQNPIHLFSAGNATYYVTLIISNMNTCPDTIIKPVYIFPAPPVEFEHTPACLAETVYFNANTGITLIDSIVGWSWDFGDGTVPATTPITATHTYSSTGTFVSVLTVTDLHGCTNVISHEVIVNPLPIPQFSWNAAACSGNQVQFTDASTLPTGSTGYIARWEWDFGDGSPTQTITTPASPNVSHTFPSTSGAFIVTLRVWSNDSCTQVTSHTVNLIAGPIADFRHSPLTCEDQAVQFTDISQTNGGGSITSWAWNFDDPSSGSNNTSILPNPVHTFLTAGNYDVTLIISNANGCIDTITRTVVINLSPVASFIADSACLGTPTTFINTSLANAASIISYAWEFGDGANASIQNPTHTYSGYGSFTVILHVTNSNGCISSTSRQVVVIPLPVAAFTFSASNCMGSPVQFTNMSTTVPGYLGSIKRWVWDFGDGTTANILYPAIPDITHTFTGTALTHTVRLTVITSDSCQNFIEHVVTSNPSPVALFSVPAASCESQTVAFTDLSQPNGGGSITNWNWNFGDPASGMNNFSSAQNPTHLYLTPGTYQVVLIVSNASKCTDTIQSAVTIMAGPLVNFTADTACLNSPTAFTSLSGPTVTQWLWNFGDGGTSTSSNPTHTYLTSGTFNVHLTVATSDGCSNDITKQVTVTPGPIAAFSTSAPACAGSYVYFNDLSSTMNGTIQNWHWDFGDGADTTVTFFGSTNVQHLYTHGGTYPVTLTILTSDNCSAEKTIMVLIHTAPIANFSYPVVQCENVAVSFTDQSQYPVGAPPTQWLWNFDDPGSGISNTSNLQNPVHQFSTSGTFNVVLSSWIASGCMDSVVKAVTVDASPLAQFTANTACMGSPTQFTDGSTTPIGNNIAWLWNFGDPGSGINNTSTLQNPTHNYASSGSFAVTLRVFNSNSCFHDTVINVTVTSRPNAMFQYEGGCVNTATQFTDLSLAPGSQISGWFWDFGDGTGTSTIQNPTYTYAASGTYNVKLRVTNLNNCPDSITLAVVSMPGPAAAFNHNSFYCPQGRVDFQDASASPGGPIAERLWIFEPGYSSTLANPSHIFSATDTTFAVTLIVTDNNGCVDTVIDSVYVKPGFVFSFISDTVCFSSPTHFTPLNLTMGDSLYNLRWDFGDPASGANNNSSAYNAVHTFTRPGLFAVKLRVANSDNCTDSIYKNILVHALPVPQFDVVSVPDNRTVAFDDLSTSGDGSITSWEWTFGDGSPNLIIPAPGPGDTSHYYNFGTYQVVLKVSNSVGCTDDLSKTVDVFSTLIANFNHEDSVSCARYPIVFTDNSTPRTRISKWEWNFGDGMDTTYFVYQEHLVHRYANSGIFQVKLIVTTTIDGNIMTDTMTRMIIVKKTPQVAFSTLPTCVNQVTYFMDNTASNGSLITDWSWNFGDPASGSNNNSALKDPAHRFDSSGRYNVKLLVMNESGCKDSLIKPTRVHALPEAAFRTGLACSDNPTYFTDRTTPGDTTLQLWRWNFGEPGTKKDTAMIQNPAYQYNTEGNYVVRMIVRDKNGCYDTVDSTVTVFVSPISAFSLTELMNGMPGKILLNNQSVGAETYDWDFGNGIGSTDENPVITYSEDGTYLIRLISYSKKDCSDTTFYRYDVLFKGLYIPNAFAPTSGAMAASIFKPVGVNLKSYNIEVFDAWGHQVWSSKALDNMGRPSEVWDGKDKNGNIMPQATYMWKASATFIDGTIWEGSDIGKGEYKTYGTVTLIR